MLPDGYYAVPTPQGEGGYRLIWLKTVAGDLGAKDEAFFGKRILYYKKGERGWQSFAFLNDDGSYQLYRRFETTWTPEQLSSIRAALADIFANPQDARKRYKALYKD